MKINHFKNPIFWYGALFGVVAYAIIKQTQANIEK
jgi:hypothetical protein